VFTRLSKALVLAVFFAASAAFAFWLRPLAFLSVHSDLTLRISGVESRYVLVDGMRIHYDIEGPARGSPLLLVHGLGGHAEDWQNLALLLTKAGYLVYMPDLVGFGRSDKPQDFSYSVPDQARVLADFLASLHVGKADVAGWSMGGWVVERMASEHPERVQKLVLIDSAGLNVAPTWNTNLFAPTTLAEFAELQALLSPRPRQIPNFIARDAVRRSKNNAWITHRALGSMLSGQYTSDTSLPQLRMPVLIVWGAQDKIFPLAQGEKAHELVPQSEMKVVPGCGHLVVTECTTEVAGPLVNFLGH